MKVVVASKWSSGFRGISEEIDQSDIGILRFVNPVELSAHIRVTTGWIFDISILCENSVPFTSIHPFRA